MNTEQAVKHFEKKVQNGEMNVKEYEGLGGEFKAALPTLRTELERNKIVLSALRAQQERENGCEYCDFSSGSTGACISNVGDNFILIQSENGVSIATDDAHFKMLNVVFCPMCGREFNHKPKEE